MSHPKNSLMKRPKHSLILTFLLSFFVYSKAVAQIIPSEINTTGAEITDISPSSETDNANQDKNAQSDQYYQLQILQQEVRSLRGLLEELNHQLQLIKQQQMDDYLDIDRRLSFISSSANTPSNSAVADSAVLGSAYTQSSETGGIGVNQDSAVNSDNPPIAEVVDEATMKAHYDNATGLLLKNRDLEGAITAFQSHIDNYPNSPFIPNAYYWLGEIYDLRDQKDLALQSFRIVVDIYSDHSKAMDARFKLGKLYHKQGQDQIAKQLLETAAQSNGGAAAKARAYLENNPL